MIGSTAPIPIFDPSSWTRITTGTVQDLSTNAKVVVSGAAATTCIRGMVIKFTSGACVNDFSTILAIQNPILQLANSLVATPVAGDSFEIYGPQFSPDWTIADDTTGGSRLLRLGARQSSAGNQWRPVACDPSGRLSVLNASFPDRTSGTFQPEGVLIGTALTGSYTTLISMEDKAKAVSLTSSCDKQIIITLDGGSTDTVVLDPYECRFIDLPQEVYLPAANIQAKHAGTVPNVGTVKAAIIY